jgi:GntR family transcriptional regulator
MCPGPAIAYHPSIPLRHQIQQVLRAHIEGGDIAPDERLPTELALVQRFGVSRATIRAALAALERDGLIRRRQGSGTFVRPADPLRGAKMEITHPLLGYEAEVRLVKAETVPAPGHVVDFLGVPRGEPVMRFVRVEMVGGGPFAVVVNYLGPALGRRIQVRALRRHPMMELLRERLHIEFGPMRQTIEARLPDEELASLLEITLTQPVLLLRLQVADRAGRPVEISDTFYRADRCRYEVDLSGLEPHAKLKPAAAKAEPATAKLKPAAARPEPAAAKLRHTHNPVRTRRTSAGAGA